MTALKLVRNFFANFRELLKHSELRSLEFFLGGFCLLWGVCRFIPPIGPISDAERSTPSPLFASVMTLAGVMMMCGAVQDVYRWRRAACYTGNAIWITVLLFNIGVVAAHQGFIAERVMMPVFFTAIFSWLYARLVHEQPDELSLTKGGGSIGRPERLDNPSHDIDNRSGGQYRYCENHRSAAGRT